jgi:hypothetical protein
MSNIKTSDYTNFNKGIETISIARDLQKSQLPDLARLIPSEQEEPQLEKIWKPTSLESSLKESLLPIIRNRENLTPVMYQRRLQEAKAKFKKLVEKARAKKANKQAQPFDEDPAEIFERVIADLEELEEHQDLLWMLRQVVHLA